MGYLTIFFYSFIFYYYKITNLLLIYYIILYHYCQPPIYKYFTFLGNDGGVSFFFFSSNSNFLALKILTAKLSGSLQEFLLLLKNLPFLFTITHIFLIVRLLVSAYLINIGAFSQAQCT